MSDTANDNKMNADMSKLDKHLNPWIPEKHAKTVAVIGKLGEECTEAGTAIFRSIIQGVNEAHPETGKVNLVWLFEEMADVTALMAVARKYLDEAGIFDSEFDARVKRKTKHIKAWLKGIPDTRRASYEEMFDV
jgi:hypothetical protein